MEAAMLRKTRKRIETENMIKILIAAILYGVNINVFVNAGDLVPGGMTGLSLLLQHICRTYLHISVPFTVFNVLLNAGPAIACYLIVGKKYTVKSVLCLVFTSLVVDLIPEHFVTDDLLLIAIFGGIINGFLTAMILNCHATIGGTDFISMIVSKKKGISVFNYVFIANVIIILIAGRLYGMNVSLYSIIFQFASTQMVTMLYKRYDKDTLLIITQRPDMVYNIIKNLTNHDATLFEGIGCYKEEERNLIYSVVNSDATRLIIAAVKRADPDAFINYYGSKGVRGRFYYEDER